MNEQEFLSKWRSDKKVYEAWGNFIVEKIIASIEVKEKAVSDFLKIPCQSRLKNDESLIEKAFYRKNKNYENPYLQIEDKVGIRFVVLLLDDIKLICEIIEGSSFWQWDPCKHFEKDKETDPLLFTYQSVHYVLRPKDHIYYDGVNISQDIPCEVQIRTLLQHAHAELTHDAIYKAKKSVQPDVHRTVAKSMALIETTDNFFIDVFRKINSGPVEDLGIIKKLDSIYSSFTGLNPCNDNLSITIWDAFESIVDSDTVGKVANFIKDPELSFIKETVNSRFINNILYRQSAVIFLYWLLLNKKERLLSNWPFDLDILQPLANDVGVSISR